MQLTEHLASSINCNASLLIGDSSKSEIITGDIAMQAINDCELSPYFNPIMYSQSQFSNFPKK